MKKVLRANRILCIQDDQINGYLEQGYSEINDKDEVINAPKADDVKALKAENKALKSENAKLKSENEALTKTDK